MRTTTNGVPAGLGGEVRNTAPTRTRAKALSLRDMREIAGGRALEAAIVSAGSNASAAARALGVDEAIVRRIVAGGAPLTWERITSLPPSVERALLEARLRELADAAPIPAPPASAARRLNIAEGRASEALDEALLDGEIDEGERRSLLPIVSAVVNCANALARSVERSGR